MMGYCSFFDPFARGRDLIGTGTGQKDGNAGNQWERNGSGTGKRKLREKKDWTSPKGEKGQALAQD